LIDPPVTCPATTTASHRPARRAWGAVRAWLFAAFLLAGAAGGARAALELQELVVERQDGVSVSFNVRLRLPAAVEEALQRGIPLYFAAEATLYRPRWYWRDERIARARRSWRLSYQPLTASWRVSQGGLHQSYDSQGEALAAISRATRWKLAELGQVAPDERYYVDFSYQLDTTQLPRPMQIGVGGQADWALGVEHTVWLAGP
jgi:hypothetical protein